VKVASYSPIALSGFCLVLAVYFTVTDTAWRLSGRPSEIYPELGFLFIVIPASLAALVLAIKAAPLGTRSSPHLDHRRRILSLAFNVLCLALTTAFIWPTNSVCG
jgi:hypothetical protein